MEHQFDFLVLGSGIAYLSYALKVAQQGSVAVVNKKEIKETKSPNLPSEPNHNLNR